MSQAKESQARALVETWRDEHTLCIHGYHEGCQECPIGERQGPLRFVASVESLGALISAIAAAPCDECASKCPECYHDKALCIDGICRYVWVNEYNQRSICGHRCAEAAPCKNCVQSRKSGCWCDDYGHPCKACEDKQEAMRREHKLLATIDDRQKRVDSAHLQCAELAKECDETRARITELELDLSLTSAQLDAAMRQLEAAFRPSGDDEVVAREIANRCAMSGFENECFQRVLAALTASRNALIDRAVDAAMEIDTDAADWKERVVAALSALRKEPTSNETM